MKIETMQKEAGIRHRTKLQIRCGNSRLIHPSSKLKVCNIQDVKKKIEQIESGGAIMRKGIKAGQMRKFQRKAAKKLRDQQKKKRGGDG